MNFLMNGMFTGTSSLKMILIQFLIEPNGNSCKYFLKWSLSFV